MIATFRVYLALIFLANCAGIANLILLRDQLVAQHPKLDGPLVWVLLVAALASLASVVLMWRWRLSGLWLLSAAYGVMLAINLYYGAPPAHTALGPIGLAILFALYWPVRDRFRRPTG